MLLWLASNPFIRFIKATFYSIIYTFSAVSAIITVLGYFTGSYMETVIWEYWIVKIAAVIIVLVLFIFFWRKGRYQKFVHRNLKKIADIGNRRIYYFENDRSIKEGTIIQIMEYKDGISHPFAIAIVDSVDEIKPNLMKVQHYAFIGSNSKHITQDDIHRYFYYPYLKQTGFENMRKE